MKNFDKWYYGGYKKYWNGAVYDSGSTGYVLRYYVTSGPIVIGNFHDPNSWSYIVDRQGFNFGTIEWKATTGSDNSRITGYEPGSVPPDIPSWSSVRDLVYNRALARLNEQVRGGLDLGVSLAEAGQTLRMLRSLDNIRRFAQASGFGTGRDLANGWLQWQYGWKPLMSDLFGILDESLNLVLNLLKRVRASAREPLNVINQSGSTQYFVTTWPSVLNGQGKVDCKISLWIELPGSTLDRWSSLNPVSLAWELIPYSFVVDWFYDIGSFLRSTETALLYASRFRSGYVSELYYYTVEQEVLPGTTWSTGNPAGKWTSRRILSRRKRINFTRTKLTSYPLPRPPSFKVDLGSERLLSLASLLAQMIK